MKRMRMFGPGPRPREEWEHVMVNDVGARYVDVDELLKRDDVRAEIERFRTALGAERRSCLTDGSQLQDRV